MSDPPAAPSFPRLRRGQPADAPVLARMRYAMRTELGDPTETEEAFVARCSAWMAERLTAEGPWRCWIAEEDGGPVGHAWVQLVEKLPNPVDEREVHAYVTNCYVVPEARGRGVGDRLLDAVLQACRDGGVDDVFLWPSARARSLYLRHGFAIRDDLLALRLSGH